MHFQNEVIYLVFFLKKRTEAKVFAIQYYYVTIRHIKILYHNVINIDSNDSSNSNTTTMTNSDRNDSSRTTINLV